MSSIPKFTFIKRKFLHKPYITHSTRNLNIIKENEEIDSESVIFFNKIEPSLSEISETKNHCEVVLSDIKLTINKEILPLTNDNMVNNTDNSDSITGGLSRQPPNINDIFNNLRIPEAIKDLPNFDGNPRSLFDFIENVEEILGTMTGIDGSSYARLIIRAVRNKIVGEANEVLNMYGTPVCWEDIKNNLIIHYSDKRNELSLIRDLHVLRQNSDTVEKYYSKIIEILSTLNNHIKVHEKSAEVISSKQTLYQEMSLNIFLSGLREPLGSTIRAM